MSDVPIKEEIILSNQVEHDPQQHLFDAQEAISQARGQRQGLGFSGKPTANSFKPMAFKARSSSRETL